ncbi:DNA recombination protein RmuC [Breznakiella homolactica]|uniref:DNA recombination protein RmuC n=1 Tax=Breznakiella homolactica TaxID=2798577 RepID=A0A7T8BA99_9SPIR|nr:DNA recombination protein RmuC [Breznakiella homolactica]QQO10444.1 DNA recombination protein RmuC [Breznakiella homolactica]
MDLLFIAIVAFAFVLLVVFLVLLFRPRRGSPERLLAIAEGQERIERTLREELARNREETALSVRRAAEAQASQLASIRAELARFGQGNDRRIDALRETVDRKLKEIQSDNALKLEAIRRTVDEKLHETLERRLGESFKLVGERLELVQTGLGEMRSLAAGVGDLKRVLGNVKNRGTWGEVQLISIVQDVLSPDQFALNVPVKPGSQERVELAIRLPGKNSSDEPVWLPVDAKFPKEDYERLMDAREAGDKAASEEAAKMLERRIKLSAREIRDKYIAPPSTTDFGIMFLASEGLYAECIGRPGLTDILQRDYRIITAGPTTFAALLNSLQMGFRTLAVEQRSGEVWRTLGMVKTEFAKFGDLLDKTRKKLQEAADTVDLADRKSRTIRGKLSSVETFQGQAVPLSDDPETD